MEELREALEAAVTEQEKDDATQATEVRAEEAPVQKQETTVSDPKQGSDGVHDAATTEGVQPKQDTPVKKADEAAAQLGQHRVDRAPASWKKEAKGEWAALPLHVRQEVYRREQEVNRALQESAPARQFQQEFQQTVAPFMARIQSAGVAPMQAVQSLLQADYTLTSGNRQQAAQLMAKLVKDYDIDIGMLDQALVAGGATGQPQQPQDDIEQRILRQVQQQFAPMLSYAQQMQQQQMQQQQMQQQQAATTVEQMSLDPRYPFFDELRDEMADLIEVASRRGVALSLEQAYHKAAQLNPDVSGQLQRQTTMTTAQQTHQQAQRAKAAASSVSGAPAGGGSMEFSGDGSLRGSIEAAFGNARL